MFICGLVEWVHTTCHCRTLVRDVHMLKASVGPSIMKAFVHWTLACCKQQLCVLNQFFALCVRVCCNMTVGWGTNTLLVWLKGCY